MNDQTTREVIESAKKADLSDRRTYRAFLVAMVLFAITSVMAVATLRTEVNRLNNRLDKAVVLTEMDRERVNCMAKLDTDVSTRQAEFTVIVGRGILAALAGNDDGIQRARDAISPAAQELEDALGARRTYVEDRSVPCPRE